MTPIRIAIHGAAGRMGQRLIALGYADPELAIAAALEASGHPRLGQDAGAIAGVGPIGVPLSDKLEAAGRRGDRFFVPGRRRGDRGACAERGIAAGRGHDRADRRAAADASRRRPKKFRCSGLPT